MIFFSRQFAIGTRPRVRDVPAFDLFFCRFCAKRIYDVYSTKLDFQPRRRLFLTNIRTINKSLRNIITQNKWKLRYNLISLSISRRNDLMPMIKVKWRQLTEIKSVSERKTGLMHFQTVLQQARTEPYHTTTTANFIVRLWACTRTRL